jgi:hypothetical protein
MRIAISTLALIALAATIVASPGLSAQPCDELCSSIIKIVVARSNSFAAIRGNKSQKGRGWEGSVIPPGATGCTTGNAITEWAYTCTYGDGLTDAEAEALFNDLWNRVRQRFPGARMERDIGVSHKHVKFYFDRQASEPVLDVSLWTCCNPNGKTVSLDFHGPKIKK